MWVMLLWALTLPGQEVEVYHFLLHSATDNTTPQAQASASAHSYTFKKPAVHAFVDAKPSSSLVTVSQQTLGQQLIAYLLFAKPADEKLPEEVLYFAEVGILAQIFAVILQPNAP